MLNLKIVQRGHRNAIINLTRLGNDIKKPRGLFARWGVQALRWIDENFKAEGALLGDRRWKKLSTRTIRQRRKGRRKKPSPEILKGRELRTRILQDTGRLKGSFVYKLLSGNRGIAVGTNVDYAPIHEYGSVKRNIPQRRMLPKEKDSSFTERLNKTTNNYLEESIKKSGGSKK